MIIETLRTDTGAFLAIVEGGGQFGENALVHVKETLSSYLAGQSDDFWFTADDGEPVGVAYCAPEAVTDVTWNLLILWSKFDRHGRDFGSALVGHVEKALVKRGTRLLIVETFGLPDFKTTRAFYSKCGFTQEARIRNFFAAGDDKIVYTKLLQTNVEAG